MNKCSDHKHQLHTERLTESHQPTIVPRELWLAHPTRTIIQHKVRQDLGPRHFHNRCLATTISHLNWICANSTIPLATAFPFHILRLLRRPNWPLRRGATAKRGTDRTHRRYRQRAPSQRQRTQNKRMQTRASFKLRTTCRIQNKLKRLAKDMRICSDATQRKAKPRNGIRETIGEQYEKNNREHNRTNH